MKTITTVCTVRMGTTVSTAARAPTPAVAVAKSSSALKSNGPGYSLSLLPRPAPYHRFDPDMQRHRAKAQHLKLIGLQTGPLHQPDQRRRIRECRHRSRQIAVRLGVA